MSNVAEVRTRPLGQRASCLTDVFDEFEGKWELVHDGILYTMIIKMEGEPW